MDASRNALVPVLRRFVSRPADGKNVQLRALPHELSDFAITERLPERRKTFEEVGDPEHGAINGGKPACKDRAKSFGLKENNAFKRPTVHNSCLKGWVPQKDFFAFCTSLLPIELKGLGALSHVRHTKETETIYSVGDRPEMLYIINRGVVEVMPENAECEGCGRILTRGAVFGDLELLLEFPRKATARTREVASLQCFARADFPELIKRVPSFFHFLSGQLASRLHRLQDKTSPQDQCLELSGNLANFDLVTVFQTIVNSSQTGELSILNEDGEVVSAFFFESGQPRSGQFQHLTGEEAFWQLFLAKELRGTFSFHSGAQRISRVIQSASIARHPSEMLIHAMQSRDELTVLRGEISSADSVLTRVDRKFEIDEISPEELRPVAKEVWRRLSSHPLSLRQLYLDLSVSELKIYQAVSAMVHAGYLSVTEPAVVEVPA